MANEDRIVVISGPMKDREVPVEGLITIGRNPENTIQLDDLQVSRKHAQIFKRADGVYIKDLGSGNGTYLGAARLIEHRLSDGEIVRMGRQQLQFKAGTAPEPDKKKTDEPALSDSSCIFRDDTATNFEAAKASNVFKTFFEAPKESVTSSELRGIQQRLQAVCAANQAMSSERSLDKVFDTIMGQIFSLFTIHNGLIMLKQDNSDELNIEFVRSSRPGSQIHVSSSIVKRAFKDGEAIFTNDASSDSRFGGGMSIITENISSAMCVPLTHQEEQLGVLYVDNQGMVNAFTNTDLELLVALAAPASSAIKNAQHLKMIEKAYQDTLVALANAIELRDHYTVGHTWRVTNFAVEMARELGWDGKKLKEVEMGGVLHDVGKIAVDNAVLGKPGNLTDEEFEQMKVHPERGADLLRGVDFLHPLIPYCLYHHEKWDGTGYPFGMKAEEIPIEGRLVSVADAFDAMTSTRPYRKGMDPEIALGRLEEGKNRQFDPAMVDALKRCYESGRISRILQDYNKNAAHSIACPFCSTFIKLDENVRDGEDITCNVCHKLVRIVKKEETFFGMLAQEVATPSMETMV